jgi:hypothetical protein
MPDDPNTLPPEGPPSDPPADQNPTDPPVADTTPADNPDDDAEPAGSDVLASFDWVYDSGLGPLERLVLLAIADHADDDGWFRGCLEELSTWTGLDPAAVEHVRLSLIAGGQLDYKETREKAPPRECTSHWCTPDMRKEHPQRVRLVEPKRKATARAE